MNLPESTVHIPFAENAYLTGCKSPTMPALSAMRK